MKGLKQMVADATADEQQEQIQTPVTVSPEAHRALADLIRKWSGKPSARLVLGKPERDTMAACYSQTRNEFTVNVDFLSLNPNRVLSTVTPFRLKQEAVLTGAMLHEAGHARHSLWRPSTPEQALSFFHSDGADVSEQAVALATLLEEARIEGIMARESNQIGAAGLAWTMRAMGTYLTPLTSLSTDPDQQVVDLIRAWTLRAGKAIALEYHTHVPLKAWVSDFTSLVSGAIRAHLEAVDPDGSSAADTSKIMTLLIQMACGADVQKRSASSGPFEDETFGHDTYNHADTGPWMVDKAREVLALLFPETDEGDMPMAGSGCASEEQESESESGQEGEGDEEGSDGESNAGSDEEEAEGQGEGEGEQGEDSEPEDGASPSTDDTDSEEDSEGDESESDEGEPEADNSALAQALRDLEQQADDGSGDAEGEAAKADEAGDEESGGRGAGAGGSGSMGGGWRAPTKAEREIQKGAERFLRDMIQPSEASKIMLTDQPSAVVDGAALAAWKAGGQVRDPHFFRRTHRSVEPSPPVKIAILVDVSGSMDELQKPSAILSWALSAAAMDLRNFAGRGQQIESCLIHWGSDARVIQRNGQPIPGIKEFDCVEGTDAMHTAMGLVEEEMPGFFDITENPVNRLLVQFTDWEVWNPNMVLPWMRKSMASGVNMLTVGPADYSPRNSILPEMLKGCTVQRGTSTLMKYDAAHPERVWDKAAEVLG